jgi:hypothetical protein
MKYLLLLSLMLLVSCGKDNKSGDTGNPPLINTLLPQNEFLVGHWANLDGCVDSKERGRNPGLKERFELHFFPTNKTLEGYPSGEFFYGDVQYFGHCNKRPRDKDLSLKSYLVVEDGIAIPLRSRARAYRKIEIKIIDSNRIDFRGMTLTRLSNNPGF